MGKYVILLIVITGALSFFLREEREIFSCELIIEEKNLSVGDVLDFKVMMKNETDKEQYFIGALDGSDRRLRYPHCYFILMDDDKEVVNTNYPGCGNTNPLNSDDFALLEGQESYNLYHEKSWGSGLGYYEFKEKGNYSIQFVYSTMANNSAFNIVSSFMEKGESKKLYKQLNKLPRVTVKSDIQHITVN